MKFSWKPAIIGLLTLLPSIASAQFSPSLFGGIPSPSIQSDSPELTAVVENPDDEEALQQLIAALEADIEQKGQVVVMQIANILSRAARDSAEREALKQALIQALNNVATKTGMDITSTLAQISLVFNPPSMSFSGMVPGPVIPTDLPADTISDRAVF